jgi:hypothetical protein
MTDDIPVSIPDVLAWIRRQPPSDWVTRAASALEAAQVRIAELEAERDALRADLDVECADCPWTSLPGSGLRERAEKAEAEAHHWELAEGAERDLRLRAEADAARYRALADFVNELYKRYINGESMDGSDWTRLVTLAAEREPSDGR